MTGPPNFGVGPVTLTAILYPQPAVDIRYSRRLPKNSDTMKLKRIFQGPMKTWRFQQAYKTCDLFELLHLKMEVSVSEPCDVIRVPKISNMVKF